MRGRQLKVPGAIVLMLAGTALTPAAHAAASGHEWSKLLGGTGGDRGHSVATDPSGNVLVIGRTNSASIDLGGGTLAERGGDDIVVASYAPDGAHRWSRRLGGSSLDWGLGVASDPSGNVLIAGYTGSSSIDLGGGPLGGSGSWDLLIAKYAPDGAHLWSKRLGSTGADHGYSIASDPSGNVIVGGRSSGSTIDLGGGPLASQGNDDILLARYAPDGSHLWSKRLGGTASDGETRVASDPSGNIMLAGYSFSTSIDLGGGPLARAGFADIVLAKYAPDGAHLWSHRFGGGSSEYPRSVTADRSGNVILAGYAHSDPLDLGGGPLATRGNADMIVASYAPDGTHRWSKRLGDTNHEYATATADPAGNVIVAGQTLSDSIDMGGGALAGVGGYDIVLARYAPDGAHLSSDRFGGSADDEASAVAADPAGNVIVAGYTSSASIDLGGGPLAGLGGYDIVVAKYRADGLAPVSVLDPVLVTTTFPLDTGIVTGTSIDDLSGIHSVTVTFTSAILNQVTSVNADLMCNGDGLSCSFRAEVPPLPGLYTVTAQARDRAGNTESPGPTMTTIVL